MLYRIAHLLRDHLKWMWAFIEKINCWLFVWRFGKKAERFSFREVPEGYDIVSLRDIPVETVVDFFGRQPEEAFTFFHPHGFDAKTIGQLQRNRAFLAYVLQDKVNGRIAGYCFNRCFFYGIGFRGRIVDVGYRGRGLGTAMNRLLNEVGTAIGLHLFETVSKDNVASYRSALSASDVRVVKEMPNNELYLEILS